LGVSQAYDAITCLRINAIKQSRDEDGSDYFSTKARSIT
jgi:hypothetical protein